MAAVLVAPGVLCEAAAVLMPPPPLVPATHFSNDPKKCDPTLWSHIYKPNRLQVIRPCTSVTGVVTAVRGEPDGDYHILITPDRKYTALINDANVKYQKGELVLEPICMKLPIKHPGAKGTCGEFTQDLYIPYPGQHINVTGSYVLDHDHHNWAEIHPITSLNLN